MKFLVNLSKFYEKSQPIIDSVKNVKTKWLSDKIYKVVFSNKKVYVGSTFNDLQTRLKEHLSNEGSPVYNNSDKDKKIELIVNAPCNDKKGLESVEHGYIVEYSKKYGDSLLNIRYNPLKVKRQQKLVVQMETNKQLEDRIALLEGKLKIRDDVVSISTPRLIKKGFDLSLVITKLIRLKRLIR